MKEFIKSKMLDGFPESEEKYLRHTYYLYIDNIKVANYQRIISFYPFLYTYWVSIKESYSVFYTEEEAKTYLLVYFNQL